MIVLMLVSAILLNKVLIHLLKLTHVHLFCYRNILLIHQCVETIASNCHDFHKTQFLGDLLWITHALFHSLPSLTGNRSPWTLPYVCTGKTNFEDPIYLKLQHESPLNLVYLKHASVVCVSELVDSLVQDCIISIANALEILQSCTKPSIHSSVCLIMCHPWTHPWTSTIKPKFCYGNFSYYCTEIPETKFPGTLWCPCVTHNINA